MTKAKLIQENKAQKQQITALQFELEQQKFIVEKLQKMMFGASSERFKKEEEQPLNQMQLFAPSPIELEVPTPKQIITYERSAPKKQAKSTARIPLPLDLPRIPIIIEPDYDTTGMVEIDREITEILTSLSKQLTLDEGFKKAKKFPKILNF